MTKSRVLAAGSLFAFNLCVVLAGQEAPWATPTTAQIEAIYPAIETLYIDLHKNPELAFQETQTAAKLAAHVKALGFDVTTGVGGTGVVAVMKNGSGPTVMLRTELDALPVEEKTGLPYAEYGQGEERERTAGARDACVRPRPSYGRMGRRGAIDGRKSKTLAGHPRDGGPAGGGGRGGRHRSC